MNISNDFAFHLPDPVFLQAKISLPALPQHPLARPQLIAQLNAALPHHLLLLSASPGMGKTTLLASWARQCPWPLAWVSLDAGDNDPIRFWHYILAALEPHFPQACRQALGLLRLPALAPLHTLLTGLLNEIATLEQDFVLVLDDYHFIELASLHQTVAFLVQHLPPRMHLVLATRLDPPLPLARLRAWGHLYTLPASDLLLRPQETCTFLTQALGQDLSPETCAVLHTHTEGWITGLQLVVQAGRTEGDLAHLLSASQDPHRYIQDYLAEEVFQRLPVSLQVFLLHTALVDRLNSSLCHDLTGRADSQAVLEQLEQMHAFLLPLDSQRQWYRYQHFFSAFLRQRVQQRHPELLPILHARASHWYASQGWAAEAVHHALAFMPREQLASLVAQQGQELVRHNELATVGQWLAALPADVVRTHPPLCLLQAWVLLGNGAFAEADAWLHQARTQLDGSEQKSSPLPSTLSEQTKPEPLLGEVLALQSHLAAMQGKASETIELAQAAARALPDSDHFLRCVSLLNLGVGYWLNGEVDSAERALRQAIALGQLLKHSYFTLLATCTLVQVQVVQGLQHRAFRTGQQALRQVGTEQAGSSLAASLAYVGMGRLLYEWNELEAASQHLQQGLVLAERWNNAEMLIYGYTLLAQVRWAQHEQESALQMLHRARHYLPESQRPFLVGVLMAAQQVRLALKYQQEAVVRSWKPSGENTHARTFEQLTLSRIALARQQPEAALRILEEQLEQTQATNRIGSVIEVMMLQALAYHSQGEQDRARERLQAALQLAEPEGYIRLFVDEGKPMQQLLKRLLQHLHATSEPSTPRGVSRRYVQQLLGAFGPISPQYALEEDEESEGSVTDPLDQLSEREREVVHLLTKGASIPEVAQHMTITENTVRWYIKDIYSKVGVHNRTQLLLWARVSPWPRTRRRSQGLRRGCQQPDKHVGD